MTNYQGSMVARVEALLADMETRAIPEISALVAAAGKQLREPLRVAVAGRIKAGKSTLINALARAPIAATDATECTQVVTWYRHGTTARAWAVTTDGDFVAVPYRQTSHSATVDLAAVDLAEVTRLDIELPIDDLRQITIIDTPGTASISQQISARALEYLIEGPTPEAPDVVIYMMRHAHEQDLQFLEAYGETLPADADPLRALGVLSRADEIGHGRADAMHIARHLSNCAYDDLPAMVASVLPVAGLLAFTAATLTDDEYTQLSQLAALQADMLDVLLRSVGSFTRQWAAVPVPAEDREELLQRFGLFGLRTALHLMAAGLIADIDQLKRWLIDSSGLEPIREIIFGQFAGRADVLRAARAVGVIERLASTIEDEHVSRRVLTDLDAIKANSYELDEISHLRSLQLAEQPRISDNDRHLVVTCLGGHGTADHIRVDVDDDATPATLGEAARRRLAELDQVRSARGEARHAVRAAQASMRNLLDRLTSTTS